MIVVSAAVVVMFTAPCDTTKDMLALLASRYRERPVAMGIQQNSLVQRTMSATGTWTIIRTDPATGLTCIVAAGQDWTESPPKDDL